MKPTIDDVLKILSRLRADNSWPTGKHWRALLVGLCCPGYGEKVGKAGNKCMCSLSAGNDLDPGLTFWRLQ